MKTLKKYLVYYQPVDENERKRRKLAHFPDEITINVEAESDVAARMQVREMFKEEGIENCQITRIVLED